MTQGTEFVSGGGAAVADSAVPGSVEAGAAADGAAPGAERARYAPVIGTGPATQTSAASGPLVQIEDPPEGGSASGAEAVGDPDGPARLTGSGHEVPEFLAGTAHMTAMLAGEFPCERLPEQALGEVVGAAQALVQAAQSLMTVATSEAIGRGLPGQSGHSTPDWIGTWAPGIDTAEALATARVAGTLGDEHLGTLGAKVVDGTARVSRANQVARFHQEMAPVADEESLAAMTTILTDNVQDLSPHHLGMAISKARGQLKPPPEDDKDAEQQCSRRLFRRVGTVAGLAEWQLLLDAEGEATLQAALDPLTKPRPGADEHGLRQLDPRTASQRRADALVEILTRAGQTDDSDHPTSGAGRVQITTSLDALAGKVPGGGFDEHGHRLSASAIRRLACDADLIPVVMGGPSEPLDVGRVKRLFTPGQRRAVYLRDRHCSFPGCTVPAAWTQIHHVIHWVFGGRTDVLNAAALCQRHHTTVHRYGFTATVTETEVIWHIPEGFSAAGFG